MSNIWKGLAIGMGNAVGEVVPTMERLDMADAEIGMRKESHDVNMQKVRDAREVEKGLGDIYMKHKNMLASPQPQQAGVQPAEQPVQPQPVPPGKPTGEAWNDAGVTVSGMSNIDSGTGVEIGPKASPIPQNGAIGNKPAQPVQVPPTLSARGSMLAEMHDFLMSKGRINEAKVIKKAEMDNIIQVMKISPKAGLQAWNNSPWLVEQFGPLDANSMTKDGEWSFLKFGDDGLIRWSKNGQYEVVQKPTGTGGTVNKQLKGNTLDGRPVSFNPRTGGYETDDGKPYSGKIIPYVDRVVHENKPEKLTMADAKSYASAKLQGIKNRMMIDMTPEERQDFANMPSENLLAALLSGSGKSLPLDKKEAYKKEIEAVEKEYADMADQVLGRKGKKPQTGAIGGGSGATTVASTPQPSAGGKPKQQEATGSPSGQVFKSKTDPTKGIVIGEDGRERKIEFLPDGRVKFLD